MTDLEQIKDDIRKHLLTEYLAGEDPANLTDDLDLKQTGVLDSINMAGFAAHLEATYGIKISPHEMASRMSSLGAIVGLIAKKRR